MKEITALDVGMFQLEATNALEILFCGDEEKRAEHFALAKKAGSVAVLADTLKEHYEEVVKKQLDVDAGTWSSDVVYSLALNGLDLVCWKTLARRIFVLMERI